MSAPELVIKMRFDDSEAQKQIDRLGDDGEKSTGRIAKGMKEAADATSGLSEALKTAGAVSQVMGEVQKVGKAISDVMEDAANRARELAKNFIDIQQAMQAVAGLAGKQNNDKFTIEQAKAARAANMTAREFIGFEEAFQSNAGAYLEGDQKKLNTDDDITKYQQSVAEFAKAKKVNPGEVAKLAGGVLQFAPQSMSADEALTGFGRAFHTLDRSSTDVKDLLPQMSRLMSQGSNTDEAAQMLTLFSEIQKGEEGSYAAAGSEALRKLVVKGRGDELGLEKGMSPFQMMKAAANKLQERSAAGEDLDTILEDVAPEREASRALRGLVERGVNAHGFERVAGYLDEAGEGYTGEELAKYRASDGGRRAGLIAESDYKDIVRGAKYANVTEARMNAKNELGDRLDQRTASDFGRNFMYGAGSIEEQLINEKAYDDVKKQAQAAGVLESDESHQKRQVAAGFGAGNTANDPDAKFFASTYGMSNATADSKMLELLERIARASEKTAPLSAPPPNPITRLQ